MEHEPIYFLSRPLLASRHLKFVAGYMRVQTSRSLFISTPRVCVALWVWRWGARIGVSRYPKSYDPMTLSQHLR